MQSQVDYFLIRRIALEDESAFALLYDRYASPAYSLACRIVGDSHESEDVVQAVFLDIWRKADLYDQNRGSGRSWLLSMVHHRAIDVIRRRRGGRGGAPGKLTPEFERLEAAPGSVWQEVTDHLNREAVAQALAQIPADQRKAIELAYYDGYTHQEVAEQQRVPLGTAKGRIRLGMEKLRSLLNAYGK